MTSRFDRKQGFLRIADLQIDGRLFVVQQGCAKRDIKHVEAIAGGDECSATIGFADRHRPLAASKFIQVAPTVWIDGAGFLQAERE